MKKVFSVFVALVLALSMNAAERGKFIHVDASVNKNLKPQIAFAQEHKDGADVTTLILKTVNTNEFNEFTDASRILIKFSDGKNVRLNRVAGSEVKKNKVTEKVARATITKIRVVFKENDAKDYDIAEGYLEKMASDLLKSYQEAALKSRKANSDLSDEDF